MQSTSRPESAQEEAAASRRFAKAATRRFAKAATRRFAKQAAKHPLRLQAQREAPYRRHLPPGGPAKVRSRLAPGTARKKRLLPPPQAANPPLPTEAYSRTAPPTANGGSRQ